MRHQKGKKILIYLCLFLIVDQLIILRYGIHFEKDQKYKCYRIK